MTEIIGIGHARVSKGDKEEIKNSLASQKREILSIIGKYGLQEDSLKWYIEEEARSAYSEHANWTTFNKAIDEACSNPKIKYFFDYSQERFCRNRLLSQGYKDKLRKAGVKLVFVSNNIEDPDSDAGFVADCTYEMLSEMYSRKVSKDTLRSCKEKCCY